MGIALAWTGLTMKTLVKSMISMISLLCAVAVVITCTNDQEFEIVSRNDMFAIEDIMYDSTSHDEWDDDETLGDGLVAPTFLLNWLRGEGGYASSKVAFSPTGLMVLEDVSAGEVLLKIPSHAEFRGFSIDDEFNACNTAWSFVIEHLLGVDRSDYFPYTQFLLEFSESLQGEMPRTLDWSFEGKIWMHKLIGRELEPRPFGILGLNSQACRNPPHPAILDTDQARQLLPTALELVAILGWSKVLIPIFDVIERNHSLANVKIEEKNKIFGFEDDTTIIASQHIPQGSTLYSEYDSPATFFNLFGEILPYPHRWFFQTGYEGKIHGSQHDGVGFIFEVVQEEGGHNGKYRVSWISGEPNTHQLNWLYAHHRRLLAINVTDSDIPDETERRMAHEYQNLLITDIALAILWAQGNPYEDEPTNDCPVQKSGNRNAMDTTCPSNISDSLSNRFDNLEFQPDDVDYNTGVYFSCSSPVRRADVYERRRSNYQTLEWAQHLSSYSKKNDTCLLLSGVIHSCTSFRPHVHEPIVHYPASFLDNVKRVLFVGGGDLIILHEILKYPSVELVIGMELDQEVVRSSFRHYGVQPHFDTRKVKWWFGDASKSLTLLSSDEYFGTFDLVFIDLLSIIIHNLRVENELLSDYMVKLLKPEGILVRQEDFVSHNIVDFAKHTLDFTVTGLPYLCQQSFTMGSNGLDFTKKKRINHNIETIFFNASDTENHTSIWTRFNTNKRRDRRSLKGANKGTSDNAATKLLYGVLVIIEAEDASVSTKDAAVVRADISEALQKSGLVERYVEASSGDNKYSFVFVLDEGYVVARIWPEHSYCAFDLQLWNTIDKHDVVAAALVSAVGGDWERSTTSFQITTGGKFGLGVSDDFIGESATVQDPWPADDVLPMSPLRKEKFDVVLHELSSSLMHGFDPVLVVICADSTVACKSWQTLSGSSHSMFSVVPVSGCLSIATPTNMSNGRGPLDNFDMLECERKTRGSLRAGLAGRKIRGIVIDSDVPKAMGQILHKIFNNSLARQEMLTSNFAIFAITEQSQGSSWKNELLERFRMHIVLFNPVVHSTVVVHSMDGSMVIDIFAYGDSNFHLRLCRSLEMIREITHLNFQIEKSKVGVMNHVPNFAPDKVALAEEYGFDSAYQQWVNQKPLGQQSIIQFEVIPSQPLHPHDPVMINFLPERMSGHWVRGKVLVALEGGRYSVETDDGVRRTMDRAVLRLIDDYTAAEPLEFGELVLRKFENARYIFSAIVDFKEDGSYTAQDFSSGDYHSANRSDLVRFSEKPTPPTLPAMSCFDLETALDGALRRIFDSDVSIRKSSVGDGCLVVFLLGDGGLVASWDGRTHVDVNIFLGNASSKDFFDGIKIAFLNQIPYLTVVQHDLQPRGYGRVVNSLEDLNLISFANL